MILGPILFFAFLGGDFLRCRFIARWTARCWSPRWRHWDSRVVAGRSPRLVAMGWRRMEAGAAWPWHRPGLHPVDPGPRRRRRRLLTWVPMASQETHRIIFTAIVAALLVPLAEETPLSRVHPDATGARAGRSMRTGCFLGALIFMLAHFVKIPVQFDYMPVHAWSGRERAGPRRFFPCCMAISSTAAA